MALHDQSTRPATQKQEQQIGMIHAIIMPGPGDNALLNGVRETFSTCQGSANTLRLFGKRGLRSSWITAKRPRLTVTRCKWLSQQMAVHVPGDHADIFSFTQSPGQWTPRPLTTRVKRLECEPYHSAPFGAKVNKP